MLGNNIVLVDDVLGGHFSCHFSVLGFSHLKIIHLVVVVPSN